MNIIKKWLITKICPDYFEVKKQNKQYLEDIECIITGKKSSRFIQAKEYWSLVFDCPQNMVDKIFTFTNTSGFGSINFKRNE